MLERHPFPAAHNLVNFFSYVWRNARILTLTDSRAKAVHRVAHTICDNQKFTSFFWGVSKTVFFLLPVRSLALQAGLLYYGLVSHAALWWYGVVWWPLGARLNRAHLCLKRERESERRDAATTERCVRSTLNTIIIRDLAKNFVLCYPLQLETWNYEGKNKWQ